MKAKDLMINCKSLMIGDFISYHGKKYQVRGIKEDNDGIYRCLVDDDNHFGWWLKIEDIQPIPLTPEILEKNGFENDFYEDESVADYHTIRLEGYTLKCKANGWDSALVTWCNGHLEVVTDFNGEVRKDIDNVHELQHALRLCGIKKEIEL